MLYTILVWKPTLILTKLEYTLLDQFSNLNLSSCSQILKYEAVIKNRLKDKTKDPNTWLTNMSNDDFLSLCIYRKVFFARIIK